VLSTLIRFIQEAKSHKAADKLKEMVSNTATVIRRDLTEDAAPLFEKYYGVRIRVQPARKMEVPIKQLVPGDVVMLAAGDMIPADCRVLTAKDLFVSQAAMTGESLPVEKFAHQRDPNANNPFELDDIVFMGTNVVSGAATAVVVSTGNRTYFGALASRIISTERVPTQFQAGVNKVSWLMIRFILVMTPLVLLINGFTKGDWLEALLFALSVAVGLTPEMLPMIVTSTLAKGAVLLSRRKVIVKRLDAIQNFGAMDILCTDKTGTLTQDRIFLERHTDVWGEASDAVLECAYLNSYYQTGLKNLLDVAVLEHAEVHRELEVATAFRKVDEIPFDFQRRRMSVVVAEHAERHLLICKGAVEEILGVVSRVRHGEGDEPLTPELLARTRAVTASLNEEGLRVVAVAVKELPPSKETYGVADESDLTLIGYVAFLDPPKESATPALQALAEHGVTVKVLTGDNELVTAKICKEVELPADGILLGSDAERMSDGELAKVVDAHHFYAKFIPTTRSASCS
jgi:Mg2+-importing ATPase